MISTYIFWAPLAAAVLHIFEEFVFPGGFKDWYKNYKPGITKSISTRFLVLINLGLLILCYDIGALKNSSTGISVILWLGVMAMLAANGMWHIKAALKTKKYSPGVATGTIIYIPLAVYGFYYFISSGLAPIVPAIAAIILGASYQLWSNLFHRFRSRKGVNKDLSNS